MSSRVLDLPYRAAGQAVDSGNSLRAVAPLLMSFLVSAPGEGLAQQDARFVEARRLFEDGVRLLEDARFGDAVDALERSRAIRETPPVLYNLGLALRGMGEYRKANIVFERFLETATERHSAMRQDAIALLEEVRAQLGHLTIVVRGGATDVKIDGERVGMADGPYEGNVDPGPHVIEATRAGYLPARREVTLVGGQGVTVELDASASPLPAHLVVETGRVDARIRVDGRSVGSGRFERVMPARSYLVEVSAPGHVSQERTVELHPGVRERVDFRLAPAEEGGSVLGSWWLWTGAAVVVAGGVAGVLVLTSEGESPDPYDGSLHWVATAALP